MTSRTELDAALCRRDDLTDVLVPVVVQAEMSHAFASLFTPDAHLPPADLFSERGGEVYMGARDYVESRPAVMLETRCWASRSIRDTSTAPLPRALEIAA